MYISYIGTFCLTGYHFQGPLSKEGIHFLNYVSRKGKLMYCSYCFEYDNAWSILEQKSQHFLLLGRVSQTGSGFR